MVVSPADGTSPCMHGQDQAIAARSMCSPTAGRDSKGRAGGDLTGCSLSELLAVHYWPELGLRDVLRPRMTITGAPADCHLGTGRRCTGDKVERTAGGPGPPCPARVR